MKSVLSYDVSQEQYLFDEDCFTKKTQKNRLILQPEKNLTEDDKKPDFNDQSFKSASVLDVVAIFRKMKLEGLKAFGNTVIQYARQFYCYPPLLL